jgi:hypothetical protein
MATRDDGKTSPFMDDPDLQTNIDSEKKKTIIRDSVLNPNMNQQQQAGDPQNALPHGQQVPHGQQQQQQQQAPPGQQQLHQQQERQIAELQAALEQVQYDMRQINVIQRREIERKSIIDEQHLNPNAKTADDELSRLLKRAAITPAPRAPPPLRNILSQETTAIRPYNTEYGRIALDIDRQLNDQMVLRETLTNSMQMMLVDKRTTAELTNREKESVTRLTRLMENAAQSIADLEQRKKSVIESQYKDPRTLQMPTYDAPPATYRRHHMVMNGSSIRDNVGIFNPKSSTADIYRTWKNLRKYGMQNYFTEEDYIEAFTKVVEGEAVGQLDNMITSNFNLEKILKFWAGIYGGKRNLQTESSNSKLPEKEKRASPGSNVESSSHHRTICPPIRHHSMAGNPDCTPPRCTKQNHHTSSSKTHQCHRRKSSNGWIQSYFR